MANQKFYEAVLRDALPISREYADKGWPPLLYPFFLALVQMPDSDRPAQKAFTLHMRDSIRAGALPAVRQRIPWFIENEVIEPHVTAQDFAAWLASEGVEPSPLVREWFAHEGVASPAPAPTQTAAAPAPVAESASDAPVPQETPAERRARWLAMFEAEEKLEKRGALQRLADSEEVDRSNMGKAIKKARGERSEQKRAGAWTAQLVQDGKRTH